MIAIHNITLLSWAIPNEDSWTKKDGPRDVADVVIDREREEMLQQVPNYVLIDAALWDEDIYIAKQMCKNFRSLFRGKTGEELNSVAPILFEVEQKSEFHEWLLRKMAREPEQRRGMWIQSDASLDDLRKHLRRFLRVKNEAGSFMYFRFYDPRILPYVLPNLTDEQLQELFSSVTYFKTSKDAFNEEKCFALSKDEHKLIAALHNAGSYVDNYQKTIREYGCNQASRIRTSGVRLYYGAAPFGTGC